MRLRTRGWGRGWGGGNPPLSSVVSPTSSHRKSRAEPLMPRMWKKFRQYERWFLLGLVIILLATFSISGTLTRGQGSNPGDKDEGGSVEAAPGKRVEYSTEDFLAVTWRYWPIFQAPFWGPSL